VQWDGACIASIGGAATHCQSQIEKIEKEGILGEKKKEPSGRTRKKEEGTRRQEGKKR